MESADEIKISQDEGFINHVFNFDKTSKNTMMNMTQYALIALIPVIIINKTMQRFVPDADEDKGSLEIIVEIMLQVLFIFFGMFFIHRIITFIPTHSKEPYPALNVTSNMLATLIIILSLQSKLGNKINIIYDRITDVWDGKESSSKEETKPTQTRAHTLPHAPSSTPITALPPSVDRPVQQQPQTTQQPQTMNSFLPSNSYPSDAYSTFG
jgi:hypothetical protein